MVAADNSGPTIEFPSRNEQAEELMASDAHCAGASHRVAVAPTLSPPSPVKPRSARTKHSSELACITPLKHRM